MLDTVTAELATVAICQRRVTTELIVVCFYVAVMRSIRQSNDSFYVLLL